MKNLIDIAGKVSGIKKIFLIFKTLQNRDYSVVQ